MSSPSRSVRMRALMGWGSSGTALASLSPASVITGKNRIQGNIFRQLFFWFPSMGLIAFIHPSLRFLSPKQINKGTHTHTQSAKTDQTKMWRIKKPETLHLWWFKQQRSPQNKILLGILASWLTLSLSLKKSHGQTDLLFCLPLPFNHLLWSDPSIHPPIIW